MIEYYKIDGKAGMKKELKSQSEMAGHSAAISRKIFNNNIKSEMNNLDKNYLSSIN